MLSMKNPRSLRQNPVLEVLALSLSPAAALPSVTNQMPGLLDKNIVLYPFADLKHKIRSNLHDCHNMHRTIL